MKIGILSMQRILNHGSFWQAYLLKNFFEKKNHLVEFIDIIPGRKLYPYPRNKKISLKKIKRMHRQLYHIRRKKILKSFISKELGCPTYPNYSFSYDSIIIGSDEVFNFAQPAAWGFSPQLHGAIANNNVNSYAASFGASTYEDVEKYGVKDELVKAFSNLKHISVRDENSEQIMKLLLPNAKIERHLDPVLVGDLLIPKRQEVKKNYILVYAYHYRFNDKEYIDKIKQYARTHGLKIYTVGFDQTWVDKNINVNPHELLQYFVNAECVVTDTFHGTIFAVRCHKQFVTVIRNGARGNRQKLISLLRDLHLESRQLECAEDFEKLITSPIDYQPIDTLLLNERKRTEAYLEKCLFSATKNITS